MLGIALGADPITAFGGAAAFGKAIGVFSDTREIEKRFTPKSFLYSPRVKNVSFAEDGAPRAKRRYAQFSFDLARWFFLVEHECLGVNGKIKGGSLAGVFPVYLKQNTAVPRVRIQFRPLQPFRYYVGTQLALNRVGGRLKLFSRYPIGFARFPESFFSRFETAFGQVGGAIGLFRASLGVFGSSFSEEGGGYSSNKSEQPNRRAPSLNTCLGGSVGGACLSGYRRTSVLYEVVSGFAMLFLGFCAGIGFALSQSDGKRMDLRWLAAGTASAIGSGLFAVAAVTGKLWLFGLQDRAKSDRQHDRNNRTENK